MNHRDFSKVNKNKTVVGASIDIGNFTFTPYSDGVGIKSKDPSKPVEKGIGYIRTPEGVEINFEPKHFSINRELGVPDTINIEGVLLPDSIKRHILNTQCGLSPKACNLFSKIKADAEKVNIIMDNNILAREEFMNYLRYGTTNPIKVPHEIKDVIFNDPATIVYWKDGTKTVVKVQEGDTFDPEKGLAMAFFKKMHGNTGRFNNIIHTWVGDYKPEEKEPHNKLTFGYPNEYSMEIDFPKDLNSNELDYMKRYVTNMVKTELEMVLNNRGFFEKRDAE